MVRSAVGRTGSVQGRRVPRQWRIGLAVLVLAQAVALSPACAGEWRALVVGVEVDAAGEDVAAKVDAGAMDLTAVLRRHGATDVTAMAGKAVTRPTLLRSLDGLAARTRAGDAVLVSFDGLGTRAAGEGPLAVTLLLPGAALIHPDPGQAITGGDLAAFVRSVEERGGRVMLVLDASFGPVARRADASDKPAGSADGWLAGPETPLPFARSLVLLASDPGIGSKAVLVPGVAGARRLLTFAVARALEGRADFDGDGAVSVPELVAYAARVVYQLSDQRQTIAAIWPRDSHPAVATRGIVIRATGSLGELRPPAASAPPDPPLPRESEEPAAERAPLAGPPVRLAAATGSPQQLAGVAPREAVMRAVGRGDDPDLIWDPGSRDVITPDGDLVAKDVGVDDLDGVVDRTAALRAVQALTVEAPQQVALLPSDAVQHRGSRVAVEIGNAAGRYLVLFNIRSDGAVQPLYPQPNDPPVVTTPAYTLPLAIDKPLGADLIVAVTANERMGAIEKGLAAMSGERTPMAAVQLLRDHAPPGALVGSVGVFSGAP